MQDKMKEEILDLTEDTDEEESKINQDQQTPVKEFTDTTDFEAGEASGSQTSPSGRVSRNIEKSMEKAVAEIRKGQSLAIVSSEYGIPPDVLYAKLVSRSLPRETEILTQNEESNLVKWILRANKNNDLILKYQLMDKVGKIKKVMKITPIFAKSKFGRMWYDYFMKSHPEIYENDGLLLPSNEEPADTMSPDELEKTQVSRTNSEEIDFLSSEEEGHLVKWIITSNKNNTLVFKYQLMKKVGKLGQLRKSIPAFAKSKFGRLWYENFLKKHPEIYENDELLLPSDIDTNPRSNQYPEEKENIKLAPKTFDETSTESDIKHLHPNAQLLSYGIKDAIVVLHDIRKQKNSSYSLIEKDVFDPGTSEDGFKIKAENENNLESESCLESHVNVNNEPSFESLNESGTESDPLNNSEDISYKPFPKLKRRIRRKRKSQGRPVCKICIRSFCNFSKLKRHMLTVHQPKVLNNVICLICFKKFASRYHLYVHIRDTHNKKYYKCDHCERYFKHNTSMLKHKKIIHEGVENLNVFYCDMCEKAFKYKNSLEAHIIYGHLKETMKYSCDICKKSFVKNSLMLRHRTRHTKLKPLACMHCNKTYSRKYLLREHIKECHTTAVIDEECDKTVIDEECDNISKEYLKEMIID